MAKKKADASNESTAPKKSGSGLKIVLGCGCGVLMLCLIGAGGGGFWYWKFAGVGTGPIGTASVGDLDPETEFWDFTIRPPKGSFAMMKNQRGGDSFFYDWNLVQKETGGILMLTVEKKAQPFPEDPFKKHKEDNPKLKSDPDDKEQWELTHPPQAVKINGLRGARSWKTFHKKNSYLIHVRYRYHVGDWSYELIGTSLGKSEAIVQRNAELLDVAICTFRKK